MKHLSLLTAAMLLAGSGALAQSPVASSPSASANPAPVQAKAFVAKAGASDLYEIQSSQLAAKRAQSGKVKAFARMMIQHHSTTTRDVTAAARAAGLKPKPPVLEPAQAEMIAQLRRLSGGAFDKAYIDQQRTAHATALALHSTYARQGDTPQLKAAATKAVPIVERHIRELQNLQASPQT